MGKVLAFITSAASGYRKVIIYRMNAKCVQSADICLGGPMVKIFSTGFPDGAGASAP
jgi:hypothetical protein